MKNPTIRIHDLTTNEIIDREMTNEEKVEYEQSLLPKPLTEAEQKAETDKAALLAKLGITAEEAKLLLS
jgi:hypothetical protein